MENQSPKGPTPVNESKPVGYGSSIQSDGHGNRTRPNAETSDEGDTASQEVFEAKSKEKEEAKSEEGQQ